MRVPLLRVPPHHAARSRRSRAPQHRPRAPLSRSLAIHLAWTVLVLVLAVALVSTELSVPCPPGGPLTFGGDCDLRPFWVGTVVLTGVLYVAGLSAVRWWTSGLQRRGVADRRAARDWYLLAATLGLVVAPLLGFVTASALR